MRKAVDEGFTIVSNGSTPNERGVCFMQPLPMRIWLGSDVLEQLDPSNDHITDLLTKNL